MTILTGFLLVVHVVLALFLILFVLLHRGSGGGLSDMFGGGAGGGLQGSAVVEKNLDRLTIISALAFGATNVALVITL